MNLRELLRYLIGGSRPGGEAAVAEYHGMDCPYESEVLAYMEDRLTSSRREQLDTHFADCGDCREFFALFVRATTEPAEVPDAFAGVLAISPPDNEVRRQSARVLAMIEEDDLSYGAAQSREKSSEPKGFYISLPRFAMAAVALIAVTIISFSLFMKTEPAEQAAMQALAQAVKTERRTPVRVSGGFDYSPHPLTRGVAESNNSLHFDRAFSKLRSAEKPSAPASERLMLARAYLARNASGDASRARTILEEIAASGETSPEIENDKGVALFELENYQAALNSFKKALEKNSKYHEALFNKALVEEKLKLYSEAKADWELFITTSPDPKWREEAQQNLELLKQTVR
jgi:tetratricopeptide (TPR) repeat protein